MEKSVQSRSLWMASGSNGEGLVWRVWNMMGSTEKRLRVGRRPFERRQRRQRLAHGGPYAVQSFAVAVAIAIAVAIVVALMLTLTLTPLDLSDRCRIISTPPVVWSIRSKSVRLSLEQSRSHA